MNEYNDEYEWDIAYCYPNTFVLKNKLDIHEKSALCAEGISKGVFAPVSALPVAANP